MHITKVNVVYTSLAIGAVVCTTLTHFGAITVKIKASSGTVIVLAKERSKEQGQCMLSYYFFSFRQQW